MLGPIKISGRNTKLLVTLDVDQSDSNPLSFDILKSGTNEDKTRALLQTLAFYMSDGYLTYSGLC
jgi:hypothetical protein